MCAKKWSWVLIFMGSIGAYGLPVLSSAGSASSYHPEIQHSLHQGYRVTMNLGLSGDPFDRSPKGVEANPPKAADAIGYLDGGHVARIKVANDPAYQQEYKAEDGATKSPTRAEFTGMRALQTFYQEGDERIYRVGVRLDPSWPWDDSPAIFTQFKRTSGGPDMFLAVKRRNIVLRIGRPGAPQSSESVVIPAVEPGRWFEILLKVRWSVGTSGNAAAYYRYADQHDHTLATSSNGPNMQSIAKSTTYVKFGIYKPAGFAPGQPATVAQTLDIGNVAIFAPEDRLHQSR